jgi:phosphopentomutase
MRTGRLIVYTSADSVFQIAAHEDVVPIERLDEICRAMRRALRGEHAVGRVIARPFVGGPGHWQRTDKRRDFSLEPPGRTMLDHLVEGGHDVVSVGKVDDVFAGRGITHSRHVLPNAACVDATIEELKALRSGLVFTNLVEFDTLYGHRNDPVGMARALAELDVRVPAILDAAGSDGVVVFTADHGNDPTSTSTDHSREEVPLLAWAGPEGGAPLGTRASFADLGATVCELFGVGPLAAGRSFLRDLPVDRERARLPR